jgi:hypothetical protein
MHSFQIILFLTALLAQLQAAFALPTAPHFQEENATELRSVVYFVNWVMIVFGFMTIRFYNWED